MHGSGPVIRSGGEATRPPTVVSSPLRSVTGLDVRVGVHTGEVEIVSCNIRGLSVHETARIMALAGAGEILVSGTTRELASASGLIFEDRAYIS